MKCSFSYGTTSKSFSEIFDNCAVIEERTGETAFYDVGVGNGAWVPLIEPEE